MNLQSSDETLVIFLRRLSEFDRERKISIDGLKIEDRAVLLTSAHKPVVAKVLVERSLLLNSLINSHFDN